MNSAQGIGQFIGLGICIFLPLVAIILNGVSLRRHRTNNNCALAIMGTMLAVILLSLSGLGSQARHIPLRILEILTLSGGGFMVVSTVLAIVGLVQCYLRRRYTRGRWRAVIALLLNATFLTFIIMNTIDGIQQGVAMRNLLQPASTPGELVTNEAWNFRLQPPHEWDQIDPAKFGVNTRAAIERSHPEMYALITAEDFPEGVDPSLSGAMDHLKRTMHIDGKVEFLAEEEKEERDFLSRTLEMRSREPAGTFFHVFWIMHNGNTLYRIHTWGAERDEVLIREDARKITDGFRLVDPRRATPKTAHDPDAEKRESIPLPAA